MFCLPPAINRKLRAAIESGELNVDDLIVKTGDERVALLTPHVGAKYAENTSKRFASKFNTELSEEAVKDIIDSMAKVNKLRASAPKLTEKEWEKLAKGPAWAEEYTALQSRMEARINPRSKLGVRESAKGFLKEEYQRIVDQPTKLDVGIQAISSAARVLTSPVYKSLKASADLSYALRQGFKVMTRNPKEWKNAMKESFAQIAAITDRNKADAILDAYKARYYAHPNYDKLVVDGKLAFGVVEDWFPTHIAEKIPALGNIFKSSNNAFTVFSQSARFGLANDMLMRQEALLGRALTPEELQSIAYVANSITGRGSLGRLEAISGHLNKLFFSARYISSQLDTFAMPFNRSLTPFARQEALKSSVATLGSIAAIMATASAFGEVEGDPRSTNFGKMRIEGTNNWVDLTAGIGSYITLASRQYTGESVDSKGRVVKLGDPKVYKGSTRTDVAFQWFENKLAPAPSLVNQVYGKGELYGGDKPTVPRVATELLVPISLANMIDYMSKEETATALLMGASDILGASVKTPY